MKKILIVEDEISLLNAIRDKLTHAGFSIIQAHNGKEGLEIALSEHPDLILLDIMMPVMDGITALKKMREDDWGKDAKVIILSNLSDNEKVAQALEQGTFDYLVKSNWKLEALVEEIKSKLQ